MSLRAPKRSSKAPVKALPRASAVAAAAPPTPRPLRLLCFTLPYPGSAVHVVCSATGAVYWVEWGVNVDAGAETPSAHPAATESATSTLATPRAALEKLAAKMRERWYRGHAVELRSLPPTSLVDSSTGKLPQSVLELAATAALPEPAEADEHAAAADGVAELPAVMPAAVMQLARIMSAYLSAGAGTAPQLLETALRRVPVQYPPAVTPFTLRVWRELRRAVPAGRTTSYAALGARAGSPAASRAVGQAMRTNPLPIVVPCHRVLSSDGGLAGYTSGACFKVRLLRHESATAGISATQLARAENSRSVWAGNRKKAD